MIDNNYNDEKELEAMGLFDQADNLADRGQGDEAIQFYEKAASIYLELGSYLKLDELYIKIAHIISKFKNNIQAIYRLNSIIRKTEELKLDEVSAKLLIQLGNISFRMHDWEVAGESWQKASEYLFEADPEEFSSLSSILLLKAGQAFERSSIKKDLGKRLIFKSIMKVNRFDEVYELEEKRALNLLSRKEFEGSAKKFNDIASYFKKSLNHVGEIINEEESKDTILNAKARIIHFSAEYQAVAALCLRAAEDKKFNENIKNLGLESLDLFKESIGLLKSLLFPIKKDFDNETILRITFDAMLMTIVQEMLGIHQLNPNELLLENLEENKILVKKLSESPYFNITERIEKLGIKNSLDNLRKIHLGHFELIKNMLIMFFE